MISEHADDVRKYIRAQVKTDDVRKCIGAQVQAIQISHIIGTQRTIAVWVLVLSPEKSVLGT